MTQAKQTLVTPGQGKKAAALLRQANAQWQSGQSTSRPYAESLDLFAILIRADSPDEAKTAATITVPIREIQPDEKEPLALAYEVQNRLSAYLQVDPGGPGITSPKLVSKVEPKYTGYALYGKRQGSVIIRITVSTDQVPGKFELIRGLAYGLDEAAAQALKHWRFRPAVRNGTPVALHANVDIDFRLLKDAPTP